LAKFWNFGGFFLSAYKSIKSGTLASAFASVFWKFGILGLSLIQICDFVLNISVFSLKQ